MMAKALVWTGVALIIAALVSYVLGLALTTLATLILVLTIIFLALTAGVVLTHPR